MNIADTEQKIEALTKKITKARKDHKTSSKMVADQKKLRNSILAHDRIKDFTDKEKAKKTDVERRIDEANRNRLPFDTYRPLGLTEQPTHDEIRESRRHAQHGEQMFIHTINYDDTLGGPIENMFVSTSEAADLSDPNVRRKFFEMQAPEEEKPNHPPTLWQRVKNFFAGFWR